MPDAAPLAAAPHDVRPAPSGPLSGGGVVYQSDDEPDPDDASRTPSDAAKVVPGGKRIYPCSLD